MGWTTADLSVKSSWCRLITDDIVNKNTRDGNVLQHKNIAPT